MARRYESLWKYIRDYLQEKFKKKKKQLLNAGALMILLVKDAVMRYIETRDSYLEKKKKKNRLADSGNRDWNDGIIFLGCLWLVLDFFDSGNPNDFWEKKDPVIGLIRAHSFRHPFSLSLSFLYRLWANARLQQLPPFIDRPNVSWHTNCW